MTAANISPIIHKVTIITTIHERLAKTCNARSCSMNNHDTNQLLPFHAACPIIAKLIPSTGFLQIPNSVKWFIEPASYGSTDTQFSLVFTIWPDAPSKTTHVALSSQDYRLA